MSEETLFALALEKPAGAEREAFLAAACGDDAGLRERINHLLRADEHPSGILDNTPAVPTVTSSPDSLATGRVFAGRFKLREKLGEGGMGEVWVADQTEPVQRRVALKVVRPGHDSARLVARFDQERQALALMDHPNIARVLDAGVADGRPYFVMELIKGEPITAYCDAAKLTPRERLELFLPVCHAVQHAHQKGIIHRDLKPSNIMIGLYDGKPVPKVIDFGVAKATGPRLTEKSIYTEVGALIGTLEYMSPEQAELNNLDVDTRSDIYALGAVLYELLTGSVPFPRQQLQAAAFTEMLRIIKEVEPPKPSTRLSNSGTLPSIAAVRHMEPKKLVAQMKGELDWIVMKCLEKERSRRYETANGLALDLQRYMADKPVQAGPPSTSYRLRKFAHRNRARLVAAAVLGLLLLGAGGFAGQAARQAADRKRVDRARFDRNAEAVAALLDQCEEALRADRTDRATVALEAAERRVADGGAEELADRLARCRADLGLLCELNEIDTKRWSWAGAPFPNPEADAARWRAALVAYGVTSEESRASESAAKVNASQIRDRLLTVLDGWLATGPSADVKAGVRAMLRSADPHQYRDAVRDAVAAGDNRAVAALVARTEALDQPTRFAVLLGQLAGVPPERGRLVLKNALRSRTGNLGLLMALGLTYPFNRSEGAEEQVRWYQAALAAHPGNPAALNNLGLALRRKGDVDEAIEAYREAIRINPKFAIAHTNLGFALRRKNDLDGGIAAYHAAIRADPTYAIAHNNLGSALRDKEDLEGAIASFKEAIRLNPKYANAHFNMGLALLAQGNVDGAIAKYREAIQADATDPDFHYNLGNALRSKRDWDMAIAEYREAVRINPNYTNAYFNLGLALQRKGNLDGAIAAYREVIRLNPKAADAHSNLGSALQNKEDVDGAIAAFREAIRINPQHAIAHFNLGTILCDEKRDYDGAITAFRAAIRINPKDTDNLLCLGVALCGKGDLDEAIAAFREAVRLNPKDANAHKKVAWLLATGPDGVRDGKQAVVHATRACELSGGTRPECFDTLAAAYAEAGDFDQAVEYQNKALSFPAFVEADGAGGRYRLQLYEQKKPYRVQR